MNSDSKVVMIDLDGVLVDFLSGYREIQRMRGLPITETNVWSDYTHPEVWAEIKASASFWMTLEPMPELQKNRELFVELNQICPYTYFVTSRVGIDIRRQSEYWLNSYGIRRPMVIVSDRKESIAHGVNATLAIEDNAGTAIYIGSTTRCKTYLINRPWNTQEKPSNFVTRVDSVRDFLTEVYLSQGEFLAGI